MHCPRHNFCFALKNILVNYILKMHLTFKVAGADNMSVDLF